ncbi:MAG TPA: hypothetical protein VJT67_10485 [Longimicrobiaceae bacterium]|nr:hypothetical protein [Longimicrobiaceae bacterium]
MLTSSEKKDYILRLIEQMRRLVEALLHKVRTGDDAQPDLAGARQTLGQLLGPLAGIAPRMDSATAAQMVNDPDVLGAWAELLAAEAEVARAAGNAAAAETSWRRALELAIEAHLRAPADRADLLELIARLRPTVNARVLAPRHADALDAIADAAGGA